MSSVTDTNIDGPKSLSDEELSRRRDSLSFDIRSDPELRADLQAVEREIAKRTADAEREEAAEREAERRASAEQAKAEERAQVAGQTALAKVGQDRIANAELFEDGLAQMADALREEFRLRGATQGAARTAQKNPDGYMTDAADLIFERRIVTELSRVLRRPLPPANSDFLLTRTAVDVLGATFGTPTEKEAVG